MCALQSASAAPIFSAAANAALGSNPPLPGWHQACRRFTSAITLEDRCHLLLVGMDFTSYPGDLWVLLTMLIPNAGLCFSPADYSCVLGLYVAPMSFLSKGSVRPLKVILSSNWDTWSSRRLCQVKKGGSYSLILKKKKKKKGSKAGKNGLEVNISWLLMQSKG